MSRQSAIASSAASVRSSSNDSERSDATPEPSQTQKTQIEKFSSSLLTKNKTKKVDVTQNVQKPHKDVILDIVIEKPHKEFPDSVSLTITEENLHDSKNLRFSRSGGNSLRGGSLERERAEQQKEPERPIPTPKLPNELQNLIEGNNLQKIDFSIYKLSPEYGNLLAQGFKFTFKKRTEFAN